MPDSFGTVLYDATGQPVSTTFAPLSARPGSALNAPQAGLVALGHNYSTSATAGTAYAPKVDANGNQYTIPSTATQAGTAVASASSVVGNVVLALQGLVPGALQLDALGNLLAQPTALPTFSVIAQATALASGKSLLAVLNKSASSVLRLVAVYAQNSSVTPNTLTTYYIYAEQLHFITGYSNGTTLTPAAWDSADQLASGITAATGATVTGEGAVPLRRWVTSGYPLTPGGTAAENTTADEQGRFPWSTRLDPTSKLITIRPGMGLHLKAASTSTNANQDITFVFTQAAA